MVNSGHNVFITGQAGTRKSFLVKNIFRNFIQRAISCEIVCSSGVAGTVYNDLGAPISTVHAFYGLETADLPCKQVIERATSNNLVRERLKEVQCIIWDEASMSSRRVFEIANFIHHMLALENDALKPFAGKQVVVVGEFLQLQPVPNFFDEGRPMFESLIFSKLLPHRYELITIMRQNPRERQFLECLMEIQLGKCSDTCKRFVQYLSRNLKDDVSSNATHIFFRKLSVLFHNSDVLRSMPGEFVRLEAIDEGDTKGIQCPAEKIVMLKPGCKVMLLWNVSEKLRNGTSGVFVQEADNQQTVDFPDVGRVRLKREKWHKRLATGMAVGTRAQYPVAPMYAITCHKSQGLTLPAAVVHCSREFVPGLTYVSFARVESSENLQVVGFSSQQLLTPGEEFQKVCEGHCKPVDAEYSCCRNNLLTEEEMTVTEAKGNVVDDAETLSGDDVWRETEWLAKSFFERGEPEEQVIDLQTVYALLLEDGNNSILWSPPADFDLKRILGEMKVKQPLSEFAQKQNEELDKLMKLDEETTEVMGRILWSRAAQIIIEDSISHPAVELKITQRQWTADTHQLYMLITRSASFYRDIQLFFNSQALSQVQTSIGAEMMVVVYEKVVETAANQIRVKEASGAVEFDVKAMEVEGLAKVRYVGAWAVRKVLDNKRKYAKEHVYSANQSTVETAKQCYEMCELFEEYVIENKSRVEEISRYPETLSVTEEKQFRCRGLLNISDTAYEFFLETEGQRVKEMNEGKLRLHKEDTIDNSLKSLQSCAELKAKWMLCFPPQIVQGKQVIYKFFQYSRH